MSNTNEDNIHYSSSKIAREEPIHDFNPFANNDLSGIISSNVAYNAESETTTNVYNIKQEPIFIQLDDKDEDEGLSLVSESQL